MTPKEKIMTPKEKAKELVDKFMNSDNMIFLIKGAKECALITVDEILETTKKYVSLREKVQYSKTGFDNVVHTQYDKYWQEVKQEIKLL